MPLLTGDWASFAKSTASGTAALTSSQSALLYKDNLLDDASLRFKINDRICLMDEDHCGEVYVPELCILADPDFYDINDWEEVTKNYLLKGSGCSTEGLETPESPKLL